MYKWKDPISKDRSNEQEPWKASSNCPGVTIWEPRWTIMFPEFVNFFLNKEGKILENGLTWYYKHTQCLDADATLNRMRHTISGGNRENLYSLDENMVSGLCLCCVCWCIASPLPKFSENTRKPQHLRRVFIIKIGTMNHLFLRPFLNL